MYRKLGFLTALILFTSAVTVGLLSEPPANLRELYEQPVSEWPAPTIDSGVVWQELGPLPEMKHPESNPSSRSKVALGKMLFFDPRVSSSGHIACASCHDPELGWSNGRSVSLGHKRRMGTRNSISIINSGYMDEHFWDGRALTLENQATFPIGDSVEMATFIVGAPKRIGRIKGYDSLFEAAFGDKEITIGRMVEAIASFERTIVSRKNSLDHFMEGSFEALDDEQLWGLHLFRTKARCMNCHNGPLMTDQQYHNLGQSFFGTKREDLGRYYVTGDTTDVGKFRTPGLRDVMYTGPWLHAGNIYDINELMFMYDQGMPQIIGGSLEDHPLYPVKDPHIQKLELSKEERDALVAFLHAISRRPSQVSVPSLPQ